MLITLRSLASKQLLAIAVEAEATHGVSAMVAGQLKQAIMSQKQENAEESDTSSLRGSSEDNEGCRMTPMEVDVQLQAAELVFRMLLEGRRPEMCAMEVDDWLEEVCGREWADTNKEQRKVVLKQMKDAGENTPMWLEASGHASDIGWEMLEVRGACSERVRMLAKIDRTEVIEQLRDLRPKLAASHYARCGAGFKASGFRALVAVLHVFARDPDMLDIAAQCLTLMVTGIDVNRDTLAEVHMPLPPAERRETDRRRGWSFFRAALYAFMVQAGADVASKSGLVLTDGTEDKATDAVDAVDFDATVNKADTVDREHRKEVAVRIAECIAATKEAPAMMVQLRLLREEPAENAPIERRELCDMVEPAKRKAEELLCEDSSPGLRDLLDMLSMASD